MNTPPKTRQPQELQGPIKFLPPVFAESPCARPWGFSYGQRRPRERGQGHLWPGWPQTDQESQSRGPGERPEEAGAPCQRHCGRRCGPGPPLMSHVTWSPSCGSSSPLRSAAAKPPGFLSALSYVSPCFGFHLSLPQISTCHPSTCSGGKRQSSEGPRLPGPPAGAPVHKACLPPEDRPG